MACAGARWTAAYPVLLALTGRAAGPRGDADTAPYRLRAYLWQQRQRRLAAGRGRPNGLPQSLADRFGWEQQVALIAQVYHGLPPDQQRVACIFTENYGEASALVQFGGRYHLPQPISGHNAFYLWGPEGCTGQVLITINIDPQDAAQGFGSVTLAATTSCENCVSFRESRPYPDLAAAEGAIRSSGHSPSITIEDRQGCASVDPAYVPANFLLSGAARELEG